MKRTFGSSIILLNLVFFCFSFLFESKAQELNEENRLDMRKRAEDCVKGYFFGLNQIGDPSESAKKWREDDINNILNNYFVSPEIPVFDDLNRIRLEDNYYSIKRYLENIGVWYQQGLKIESSLDVKNPCVEKDKEEDVFFYYVKVVVAKKLEGIYFIDNAANINRDSLDVYVKFRIEQNRPTLKTGLARIYNIVPHTETVCQLFNQDSLVAKITDFENEALKRRAELFVRDYALTLNIIGNPTINERFNTTDYFERTDNKVFNDLLFQILLKEFTADDYLNNIENYFLQGITFDYRHVRAKNVLIKSDFVSVEVETKRLIKVPVKNYRDRRKLSIFIKFPVDFEGVVGAERITPRIYKTEENISRVNPINYIAAGVQLNAMNYFGDINPFKKWYSTDLGFTRPNLGFFILKKINTNFYARLNLSFGRIQADDYSSADPESPKDKYRYIRNLHFRNDITELSLVGIYDLFANKGIFYRRKLFTPYVFGGIAFFHHNPQAKTPIELGAAWIKLHPLGTEGQGKPGYDKPYPKTQFAIPLGLGVKYRFSDRIDLGFEMGFRLLFTDYLDDVSGDYPDLADLSSNLARLMSNRVLESNSALNGADRTAALNVLLAENNSLLTYIGKDGNMYSTFNGYGRRGDQRGNPRNNDFYMITGFHLSYFLNVGKERSSKEKARFKVNFE